MEVMENNQWKPMLCSQGIPMLRESMGSRIKEHMSRHTFFEKITDPHVRELLYNHTRHGEVSTDTILSKVKLLEDEISSKVDHASYRQCLNECNKMIRYETKGMLLRTLASTSMHTCITKEINAIRERYGFEAVDTDFVLKRWLNKIYNENKGNLQVV